MEANLSNLVGEVRAALGDNPRRPRFVRTVHGFGYAFSEGPRLKGSRARDRGASCIGWCGNMGAQRSARESTCWAEIRARSLPGFVLCFAAARAVQIADGVAMLEDLGSKNGTFVNGQRITTAVRLSTAIRSALVKCD